MTLDETINAAVAKFGVPREAILAGGICRDRQITEVREWIVAQHPRMTTKALAIGMHYANHSVILNMRNRIKRKRKTKNKIVRPAPL